MKTSRQQLALGATLAGLVTVGGFGLVGAASDDSEAAPTPVAEIAAVAPTDTDTPTDDAARPARPERTEELLTGEIADQVTAAALAAVPGGTVERVETDDDGAVYGAHMIDADGNRVTVTFDAEVQVVEIQEGRAGRRQGGRGGRGGPGGCHDGDGAPADHDADRTVVDDAEPETEVAPETRPETTPVDTNEL